MALSDIINTDLLLQPYNWIIVVLMLALAVFVLHAIADPGGAAAVV